MATAEPTDGLDFTPPPIVWQVTPNDGISHPLLATLADRVIQPVHTATEPTEAHPALEFARRIAHYHIGDGTWADLIIEFLAVHPDDRAERLEAEGIA